MPAFEIKNFLDDLQKTGNLTPEERTILEKPLGKPEVVKFLGESVSRQSDYSKNMNELQAEKVRLAAEIAERERTVAAWQTDLAKWKNDADGIYQTKDAELSAAQTALNEVNAKIKDLAVAYDIPEEELPKMPNFPAAPAAPGAAPAAAAPGSSTATAPSVSTGGVSKEDFQKSMTQVQTAFPRVTATLIDLGNKHRKLFGEDIPSNDALVQKALARRAAGENITLEQVWEEEFKVSDREAAIKEEEINQRIQRAKEEEATRVRSEMMASGGNAARPANAPHAPVLREGGMKRPESTVTQRSERVNNAVNAWEQKRASGQ
jgi:hypothetical protein